MTRRTTNTARESVTGPDAAPVRGVAIGLLAIFAAWLIVWTSAFGGAFVFDDIEDIVGNESVHDVSSMRWLHDGRRPVTNLTFALNWGVSPGNESSFHAVNIAIHLLSAMALFGLVVVSARGAAVPARWRGRAALLGALVAVLWLVHPLQTQSVTYIVQRAESLAGLWYLLTLLCAACGIRREERGASGGLFFGLAVVACALGMGSKAVVVTAPVAVLAWDMVFGAGSLVGALRRRWTLYVSLALTWLIVVWLGVVGQVLIADAERTVGFGYSGASWWTYLLTQTEVLWRYIRLSVWPDRLVIDYAWPFRHGVGGAIVPGLGLVALLVASVWGLVRARWWGFVGVMFFLVLAPTSSVIPIADAAMEHRMYVPLASVMALFVVGALWGLDRVTGGRPGLIAVPGLAALAVLLGVRTIDRNGDYEDPARLWRDVTAFSPGNARGWNNYGQALMGEDPASAQAAFERSLGADASFALARINLAAAHIELGEAARAQQLSALTDEDREAGRAEAARRFSLAREAIERVLTEEGDRADALTKLAIAQFRMGEVDASIVTLGRALELEPGRFDAAANLEQFERARALRDRAKSLADDGKIREGVLAYKEYFQIVPNDVRALLDYGEVSVNSGARTGVVEVLRAALAIDPENTRGRVLLGRAEALASGRAVITRDLEEGADGENDLQASQRWLRLGGEFRDAGDFAQAEEAYRTSIDFDPTNVASRYNLGLLLQENGLFSEAILEYLDMLVFAPSRVDARSNLGVCYFQLNDIANAERAFTEALEIDAEHFQSQLNLAVVYDSTGRPEEALASYERALELVPGHSGAAARVRALRPIVEAREKERERNRELLGT